MHIMKRENMKIYTYMLIHEETFEMERIFRFNIFILIQSMLHDGKGEEKVV